MPLNPLLPGAKDPASLKLHLLFNGLTFGATTRIATRKCTKSISGTDVTGFNTTTDLQAFFGSGAAMEVQVYVEDLTTLPASDGMAAPNVDTHLAVTNPASSLITNPLAKDLKFEVLTRSSAAGSGVYPQMWLTIERTSYSDQGDIEEVYYSFITMLPVDLATRLDYATPGLNFWTIFDIKTGGYLNQQAGDRRFRSGIIEDATGRTWYHALDNRANGTVGSPNVDPRVGNEQTFWGEGAGYGVAIDVGVPLLMEYYFKRPPKINTLSSTTETGATQPRYEYDNDNGIALAGVTNLSTGVYTTLLNKRGGRHYGASNRDDDRIFTGLYNLSAPTYSTSLTSWRVYDTIPAHSRLRGLL